MQANKPPPPPPKPPGPPPLPQLKEAERKVLNPIYRPRFKFLKLVLAQDLALVETLCSVIQATEFDDVSKALVGVFDAQGDAVRLLRWAIHNEIQCTEAASTLFRGVSVATKLVSSYFKLKGKEYLKKILSNLLKEVVVNGCRLEVDPEKIEAGDELKANQERLQFHCRVLMDNIFKTVEDCPLPLRQVFQATQVETIGRFPHMKLTVVGGFFFLRFVCPSLVAPEGYGLIDVVPDTKARRSLILVSKILQNLANQVEFGSKEEYMTIMNSFITGNMKSMASFVDKLATPPTVQKLTIPSLSHNLNPENLDLLYSQSMFMKEKILKKWDQTDPEKLKLIHKLERALHDYPHPAKKKNVVVDTVQHEVALKAVHKELKMRVERVEKNLRAAAQAQTSSSSSSHHTPMSPPLSPSPPTLTPHSVPHGRSVSPKPSRPGEERSPSPSLSISPPHSSSSSAQSSTPRSRSRPPSDSFSPTPPSPSTPSPEEEVARLIEEVVRLRGVLEAEKQKSRVLEEKVIEEEKKVEKEAEGRFHRERAVKASQIRDILASFQLYKDQLMARPDLAAEFKSLRLGLG